MRYRYRAMTVPLNICFPLEVNFPWIIITSTVWWRVSGLWELLDICVLRTAKMNIRIGSTEWDSRIFGMLVDLIDWYDVYTVVFSLALCFVNTCCVRCGSRFLRDRKFTLWSRLKRLVLFRMFSSIFEEPAFAIFRVSLGLPTSRVTKFYTLAPNICWSCVSPFGSLESWGGS